MRPRILCRYFFYFGLCMSIIAFTFMDLVDYLNLLFSRLNMLILFSCTRISSHPDQTRLFYCFNHWLCFCPEWPQVTMLSTNIVHLRCSTAIASLFTETPPGHSLSQTEAVWSYNLQMVYLQYIALCFICQTLCYKIPMKYLTS